MIEYLFTMRTATTGLQWHYHENFADDEAAVTFAKKEVGKLLDLSYFLGIDVWKGNYQTANAKSHIAFVTAKHETIASVTYAKH